MAHDLQNGASANVKRGAFSDWRVILLTKRTDSFVRLLEAGGAQVLAAK